MDAQKHRRVEDIQDGLASAIDSTRQVLIELTTFNKDKWIVRSLPNLLPACCSLSFADNTSFETNIVFPDAFKSATFPDPSESGADSAAPLIPTDELTVLHLDLKLGAHTSPSSAASLVTQLEKSSIANLLDERINAAISHIDKLRLRVEDTSSKVLVTGDLNAGKSTFVNALIRREVMPVDQQPCTTAFCEVHDAAENHGKEEVHIVKEGTVYDVHDESTYTKGTISDLEQIVAENEDTQQMIKVYLADTRAPSESLLNNGIVDISLIDAPGLNRDSLKTTAVFARQEEIDVVVFVVSAENHLTLSAREFLRNASNEKAYLFIVVNKYGHIRNKDKCKRLVLEQIKELSPRTYEDSDNLVHFVDSAAALQPYAVNPTFDDLETALRTFILEKRSKSKLQPVLTFLSKVLSDLDVIAKANSIVADHEIHQAHDELSVLRPVLEKMKNGCAAMDECLEAVEEDGASNALKKARDILTDALDRLGQGKLGVDRPSVSMPPYPGFFGIWDYVHDVKKALLTSLDEAVKLAEDEARIITTRGVNRIRSLENEHLPEGVERSRRVFMPEAMFSAVRRGARGIKSRRSSSVIVAGGLHGLGIGIAQKQDMLETTFFDLFDLPHDGKEADDEETSGFTALSIVGYTAGALTMVGGPAIGIRGLIGSIVWSARRWVAPILGVATVGLTVHLIVGLPYSIPRTVGRRIRASIRNDGGKDEAFVESHAERVSKETRKKFKGVMDDQEIKRSALGAKDWFAEVLIEEA
ncbi:transmembrane GTPase fzo1 [Amanita rubescens]|nr:transmembrane GTPase fzo1 [Amanita rubescens]